MFLELPNDYYSRLVIPKTYPNLTYRNILADTI